MKNNSTGVVLVPVAIAVLFMLFATVARWVPEESIAAEGTGAVSRDAPVPKPLPFKRAPTGAAAGIAKDGDGKWHAIITDDKGYVICSPGSSIQLQSPPLRTGPGCPIDCGFYIPAPTFQSHFHPTLTQSENEKRRERDK